MRQIIVIVFFLMNYLISFSQNVEIVHSDYLTFIPGVKGGTKRNTYNYMLKTKENIQIDTLYINNNKIFFTENSIMIDDSVNINIEIITNNYTNKTNKESNVIKVLCNGIPVHSQLEKIKKPRQKNSATYFILSDGKNMFCLNIKKFDTETVIPMP